MNRGGKSAGPSPSLQLGLLGRFRLSRAGDDAPLTRGSAHLLAFVALLDHAVERTVVAGTLWPDVTEPRAHATLRSALARLDPVSRDVLRIDHTSVELAGSVAVDWRQARALAMRLVDAAEPPSADLTAAAVDVLSVDLLPGWYDDWVVLEAEAWRQLRLHALEALAGRLVVADRFGLAAAAAAAAVKAEPLRESAHAALIRVLLAEGNRAEAQRAFERFRVMLSAQVGLEPSGALAGLVAGP